MKSRELSSLLASLRDPHCSGRQTIGNDDQFNPTLNFDPVVSLTSSSKRLVASIKSSLSHHLLPAHFGDKVETTRCCARFLKFLLPDVTFCIDP
jgi:hypothetical protein